MVQKNNERQMTEYLPEKPSIEAPHPIAYEHTSGENWAHLSLLRVLGMPSVTAGEISPQSNEPKKTLLFNYYRLL